MSLPSTSTSPSVAVMRRLIRRRRVDLPEPEGPMTETNSPGAMSRVMSWSAWVPLG